MTPTDTAALAKRIAEEEIGGPPPRCTGHKADRYNAAYNAVVKALAALSPQGLDAKEGEMSPEERRLEDLKQMAAYAGPIVSFNVREPYYLASCDRCGWVGSSELCGTDSFGDDSDVYCPRCHTSGADCGKVAGQIATPSQRMDAATVEPRLIERKVDEDCGCPEELWEAFGAHLQMHLAAGTPSNAHADYGDEGEAEMEVTAASHDLARAAIFGWARELERPGSALNAPTGAVKPHA